MSFGEELDNYRRRHSDHKSYGAIIASQFKDALNLFGAQRQIARQRINQRMAFCRPKRLLKGIKTNVHVTPNNTNRAQKAENSAKQTMKGETERGRGREKERNLR